MSMDVGGSKKGAKGDINITPLIDVVLVLLIIFMVLTPSMLKELTANVPRKNENSQPDPAAAPIVLVITAKSELELNTEPIAPEALADKVGERLKHDRQKVVFFKVDDEALYGDVVKFMDIVKGAGANTLGIITKD
jgi:biopolymer transport protein TolR